MTDLICRDNYFLVREHQTYLREFEQYAPRSLDLYWSDMKRVLQWAGSRPLAQADAIRPTLPDYLAACPKKDGSGLLDLSTRRKTIQFAGMFFKWGKLWKPEQFETLPPHYIQTLRPPSLEGEAKEHIYVSIETVRRLIQLDVPERDLATRCAQAAAAFLFLSGMRAGAFGSLPIGAIDFPKREVRQWPSLGVRTKKRKARTTFLLDVPDLREAVERWDSYVRCHLPTEAMWFTPILNQWGEHTLLARPSGEHRNQAVTRAMRRLFTAADLPYQSPHKFRHGHAMYALLRARDMADYKAISLNLMHSDVRVTDQVYTQFNAEQIRERITRLGQREAALPAKESDLYAYLQDLAPGQIPQALHILVDRLGGSGSA